MVAGKIIAPLADNNFERIFWVNADDLGLEWIFNPKKTKQWKILAKSRRTKPKSFMKMYINAHRTIGAQPSGKLVAISYEGITYMIDSGRRQVTGAIPSIPVSHHIANNNEYWKELTNYKKAWEYLKKTTKPIDDYIEDEKDYLCSFWPSLNEEYIGLSVGFPKWEELAIYDLKSGDMVLYEGDIRPIKLKYAVKYDKKIDVNAGETGRMPPNDYLMSWLVLNQVGGPKYDENYECLMRWILSFRALLTWERNVFLGMFLPPAKEWCLAFAMDWSSWEIINLSIPTFSEGWPVELSTFAGRLLREEFGVEGDCVEVKRVEPAIDYPLNEFVFDVVFRFRRDCGGFRKREYVHVVLWFDVRGRLLGWDLIRGDEGGVAYVVASNGTVVVKSFYYNVLRDHKYVGSANLGRREFWGLGEDVSLSLYYPGISPCGRYILGTGDVWFERRDAEYPALAVVDARSLEPVAWNYYKVEVRGVFKRFDRVYPVWIP